MERDSMVVLGARARGLSHRLCPPGLPGGHNLWDRPLRLPAGSRHIFGPLTPLPKTQHQKGAGPPGKRMALRLYEKEI